MIVARHCGRRSCDQISTSLCRGKNLLGFSYLHKKIPIYEGHQTQKHDTYEFAQVRRTFSNKCRLI